MFIDTIRAGNNNNHCRFDGTQVQPERSKVNKRLSYSIVLIISDTITLYRVQSYRTQLYRSLKTNTTPKRLHNHPMFEQIIHFIVYFYILINGVNMFKNLGGGISIKRISPKNII